MIPDSHRKNNSDEGSVQLNGGKKNKPHEMCISQFRHTKTEANGSVSYVESLMPTSRSNKQLQ